MTNVQILLWKHLIVVSTFRYFKQEIHIYELASHKRAQKIIILTRFILHSTAYRTQTKHTEQLVVVSNKLALKYKTDI